MPTMHHLKQGDKEERHLFTILQDHFYENNWKDAPALRHLAFTIWSFGIMLMFQLLPRIHGW